MRFLGSSVIAAAWIALQAAAAGAEPSEQIPIGPRAIAMGSCFTAIADDATALFWNPAGLVALRNQEFAVTHADLFGTGIQDNYAAFVLPLSPRQVLGVDWYHSGFEDTELDFGEDRIDLAYAFRPHPIVSGGVTGKFLARHTDLDGFSVREGRGFGMDLGVLVTPVPRLRLGLVGQDLFDTSLQYSQGGSSVVFSRNVRAAAAWSPNRYGTVAFDVDDRWHLGLEVTPIEDVALRGGFEDDREGSEDATYTTGVGLRWRGLRFDYAYVMHPVLGNTHHYGMAVGFNFNPARIQVHETRMREVYASLYKAYARESLGVLKLENLEDRQLEAQLSVFVPRFMERPSEQTIALRPRAKTDVPLTAVFSDRAMRVTDDRTVQTEIKLAYRSARFPRTERIMVRTGTYRPGAIHWGEGVEQAAAYVTTRDPAVAEVARVAARTVSHPRDANLFANRTIATVATLVDALRVMGMAYVPDPNNPFATISEQPHAVDTIHYPSETLARRAGDCDDTTVLLAALLGNVGISSRFVDVPGHLFLLADTGLHPRHAVALGLDPELCVESDDALWMPIETTAISRGFAEAWRVGAERYAAAARQPGLRVVDVQAAQARFVPADPVGSRPAPELNLEAVRQQVNEDARAISAWRERYLNQLQGDAGAQPSPSPEALYQLVRIHALAGQHDRARQQLDEAVRLEPRSARALNNAANLLFAAGDFEGAANRYAEALRADSSDAGIWLNLGVTRWLAGTPGAGAALARGVALSGGFDGACHVLALPPASEQRGDDRTGQIEGLREVLRGAAQAPPVDPGARRPTITVPPRERAAALGAHLYWKL